MKDLNLLVWLTQLGFSVVFPLAGFIMVAVWLHQQFGVGTWVIWVGIVLGFYCAIQGFRSSLKMMEAFAKDKKEKGPPPVAFNDHE